MSYQSCNLAFFHTDRELVIKRPESSDPFVPPKLQKNNYEIQ